ncbi:MAG: cyclic nucleotide-binding domain-containing protein [Deltaproteobacteria bacterium]|nr:cyclic nucleotide-binding domain-containing protein [Deltaproteobacteria bacterium]
MSSIQTVADRMRQDQESLWANGESLHYKKGQELFYQGHDPCGVYWIRKGQVALIHTEMGGEHFEEKGPGTILGLEELLKGEAFMHTGRAVNDCEICFIPKIVFLDWMEEK